MSRKKQQTGSAEQSEAAVLVDFQHEGKPVKAGTIFTADAAVIDQLVSAGVLDANEAAVAALKIGA